MIPGPAEVHTNLWLENDKEQPGSVGLWRTNHHIDEKKREGCVEGGS
jgi:hypothetical protein